ncbi:hypothetical protein H9L13_06855 [Sphingomonas lutea]|uniref:DUF3800 domain-containing protein n=1 Tax=Sphingomonas lutea TaxID=1045317 RepID=A0A7G9SF26_9SPHN|nr:hypothetical protein [Sphingomonas lutea]QNN66451.1 hypothetical protein H9L13_06855 [Sphingomonas lutea]
MSFVYIDESIHTRAGFILAAAVWSDVPPDEAIESALQRAGLRPGIDEFKSSAPMAGDPLRQALRDELRWQLLQTCKIAVAICGIDERAKIGGEAISLVQSLDVPVGAIFLDAGLRSGSAPVSGWTVHMNCDSREVLGIQLADCAAHTISGIILSELGHVTKYVATADPLYAPEVELDFKLWASLRYALGGKPVHPDHEAENWEPVMHPFGLSISQNCPPSVVRAAEKWLGSIWFGCIH